MENEKRIGDWRPSNWPSIKAELARQPIVWSLNKPTPSHEDTIIEATASKILEEYGKYIETRSGSTVTTNPAANSQRS